MYQINDLPIGETVVGDEPMIGFKFLINCVHRQSILDMMKGEKPIIHDRCYTKVIMNKSSKIIRPGISIPLNDLRTDNYTTCEIMTFDGKKCSQAKSPVRDMVYETQTNYTSGLNTISKEICTKGLHFYPSMQSLIDDRFGFTGWK